LKVIRFIISSNIFISLAAVSLAMATEVELGISMTSHAYLWVIFLATLSDYNLHRLIAVNKPENRRPEKFSLVVNSLALVKILLILSTAGLAISLFFVKSETLYILAPLALISFLYSIIFKKKQIIPGLFREIPGIKTLLLAIVWTCATVGLPVLQTEIYPNFTNVVLIFAERFTFIFAIAIPFDVRDMKGDGLAGIRTLPIAYGVKRSMVICNSVMALSIVAGMLHYLTSSLTFLLPAYIISVVFALYCINSRNLNSRPLYYHGILDGVMLLHGILISLSVFL
jgi:4-hydroxybenzoate polyprenyltransferase